MTSDDALKLSVTNGQSKPGDVGFMEDGRRSVPGAPAGTTPNDVIAALGLASSASAANEHGSDGWFQARGLPYANGGTHGQLRPLSATRTGIGPVKVLVPVRDDDTSTTVWGVVADGS
jgi:hypothetical protein